MVKIGVGGWILIKQVLLDGMAGTITFVLVLSKCQYLIPQICHVQGLHSSLVLVAAQNRDSPRHSSKYLSFRWMVNKNNHGSYRGNGIHHHELGIS